MQRPCITRPIAAADQTDPPEITRLGAGFWLDACADPEIQRIVLVDAPRAVMDRLIDALGAR